MMCLTTEYLRVVPGVDSRLGGTSQKNGEDKKLVESPPLDLRPPPTYPRPGLYLGIGQSMRESDVMGPWSLSPKA